MTNRKKLWAISLILIFGVTCCSFLYDPYSTKQVENAKLKAQLCDKEAISYLGDYFEKKGLENEIRTLRQLSNSCMASSMPEKQKQSPEKEINPQPTKTTTK